MSLELQGLLTSIKTKVAINESKQCGSPSFYMQVNAALAQDITDS